MLLLRMVPNIIYCLKYFNNDSDYGIEPDTFIGLKRKPLGKQHLMEFEEKMIHVLGNTKDKRGPESSDLRCFMLVPQS